jgi:hypothetical protein
MLAPLALAAMLSPTSAFAARLATSLAGFVLGLLPLSTFAFARTQPGWVWGDWSEFFPRLVTHVFRLEYGTTTLAPDGDGSIAFGPLRMLSTLPAVLSYAFCAVLLLGLAAIALRRAFDVFGLGLAASFVTSALLFPGLFRLQGTALDRLIADRFFALPMLFLAFPLARGLVLVSARARTAARVVWLSMLVGHLGMQWDGAERVTHRFIEQHVRNLFDVVPDNAVIVTVGDIGFAGGLYGRYVLGHDDVVIAISGLGDWYQQRLESEMKAPVRRPLFLLDVPDAKQQPRVEPHGPLLRVLAPGEPNPDPVKTFAKNERLFARLRLPNSTEITRMDAFERDELLAYARAWQMVADRLRAPDQAMLRERALGYRDLFTGR